MQTSLMVEWAEQPHIAEIAVPKLDWASRSKLACTSTAFRHKVELARQSGNCVARLLLRAGEHRSSHAICVEIYDWNGNWRAGPSLLIPRRDHSSKTIDGKLVVAGGRALNGGLVLDSVEIYDPITGRWAHGPPLATPRFGHTATVMRRTMVVVGGFPDKGGQRQRRWEFTYGNTALRSVEILQPGLGQWSAGPELHCGRGLHSATVLRGELVVMGGATTSDAIDSPTTEDSALNLVEALKGDEWVCTSPMSHARHSHSCTLISRTNHLYIVGGWSPNNKAPRNNKEPGCLLGYKKSKFLAKMDIFDVKTQLWHSDVARTPPGLHRVDSCNTVGRKKICVVGGVNTDACCTQQDDKVVQVYDPGYVIGGGDWSERHAKDGKFGGTFNSGVCAVLEKPTKV